MSEALHFLVRHSYSVLFVVVLAQQFGLPVPVIPFLIGAGALAGLGRLNFALAVGLSVMASLISDIFWYELGRRRGGKVLRLLCRISLHPDTCVRRTETVFSKHGVRFLLIIKFFPAVNIAAPPLAGITRIRPSRFLLFDTLGALIWAGSFAGLGYMFSGQRREWMKRDVI